MPVLNCRRGLVENLNPHTFGKVSILQPSSLIAPGLSDFDRPNVTLGIDLEGAIGQQLGVLRTIVDFEQLTCFLSRPVGDGGLRGGGVSWW